MDIVAERKPAERKVTTLAALTENQQAAIRLIPAEVDAVVEPLEATRPNAIFTGRERFDAEQARIFRRYPAPVTVSALLPEPGMVMAHDGYGVPLLISRTKSGEIKAFLNACQHKGSKLLEDCEVHKRGRVTCPYHAWTYGIDGKLIGVARNEAFLNLDKSERGLVELPAREWGGIVYVQLDRTREADWSQLHDQIAADFTALGIPDAFVYGRKTFELKANWKVILEPFLEGYHVQRLHAASIGDLFQDAPNIVDLFGPNIRQVSGRIGYVPAMLDEDPGQNIHKLVTHAYTAFPNCVVVTSQYYTSVMILMPRDTGRTTVEYFMLTPGAPTTDKAREVFERSYELILSVFGGEDFRAAEISQVGLEAGVPETTVYCGLESNIVRYYEALEALL
ncbi:aromatic ring-hydroxylating oxygenase subunit alpha [Caulobacter segnis]|jgi:phenylpropionate dioxygenase-like ring-hydroxylating dioxygenase large terminal subunit|uniref:aromatic ring-hydroxylating oxygenase subunit alpha n=1 Tax=Caulobacter segnis TaxID=88688 RepID=UPI001CBED169|nr:aromatic ring-hydroxylating dioxygenase subunit alpha [Caulobacter segnis]UAL11714.1 aromatic ring-hydroxylating dioxygenase subunit alpha [Caulobacter segnis]